MKWICEEHEHHPDQTGVMNCDECNRCDKCKTVYYNDEEEEGCNDICPHCGEIGRP